jgi:hypothetical protein
MLTLTSPVTGAAISGLTSPTYTLTSDSSDNNAEKTYAVTALGGTQTGVNTHTTERAFLIKGTKPKKPYTLSTVPVGQLRRSIPKNLYKHSTIKDVLVDAATGERSDAFITTSFRIPVGAILADEANINAAFSVHVGTLTQALQGWKDTVKTGL